VDDLGVDGLLGMSFLSRFAQTVSSKSKRGSATRRHYLKAGDAPAEDDRAPANTPTERRGAEGTVVPHDRAKAIVRFERPCEGGSNAACENLKELAQRN
jgi:hypothetical protein